MQVYQSSDIDPEFIRARRVAILGYGAQGRAQALNLRDSGVHVTVGLRDRSPSAQRVRDDGLTAVGLAEAVQAADLVMFLLPDEAQPAVYTEYVHPHLRRGGALGFAHGFNIHYGRIRPRDDLDVVLVAPKGAAQEVRAAFQSGSGVVFLMAVQQDASGAAQTLALAYAGAQGAGHAGILATSFREETETDLFGEQAVLCGGLGELIQAAFDTLVQAGYRPELAYFECLHELKFIVQLLNEGGLARMHEVISTTAAFGAVTRGPRVVDEHTRAALAALLEDVRSGRFAEEFIRDSEQGGPMLAAARRRLAGLELESTGRRLRAMMGHSGDAG